MVRRMLKGIQQPELTAPGHVTTRGGHLQAGGQQAGRRAREAGEAVRWGTDRRRRSGWQS